MRVVVQRVKEAAVTVDRKITGKIANGLLVLAGFERPMATMIWTGLLPKLFACEFFRTMLAL